MKVIKRDGAIVPFDIEKIIVAINKAFVEVDGALYEEDTANDIAYEIGRKVANMKDCITVEEIQDLVEDYLMRSERRDVARAYIRYRYKKEMLRQSNTTDQSIKELLEGNNEYWNNENSNKNAKRTTV